jgi:hypothetical protein
MEAANRVESVHMGEVEGPVLEEVVVEVCDII